MITASLPLTREELEMRRYRKRAAHAVKSKREYNRQSWKREW